MKTASVWSHVSAELTLLMARTAAHRACDSAVSHVLTAVVGTHFAKEHDVDGSLSVGDFRHRVPVRKYSDFLPWLRRVWDGESDVLFAGKPWRYLSTSGTTTEPKIIPIIPQFLKDFHLGSVLTLNRVIWTDPAAVRGSILAIGGPAIEAQFNGIPVGSITGALYETLPWLVRRRLAVPSDVADIPEHSERLYLMARFALEAYITGVLTISPVALLQLIDFINTDANELIGQIAAGTMKPISSVPGGGVHWQRMLRPNPTRAAFLKSVLRVENRLPASRIWHVRGLCTYYKGISHTVRARLESEIGDSFILDTGLVATEGRVSVGLSPNQPTSTVCASHTFVEFLLVSRDGLQVTNMTSTLLPHELTAGCLYSPVISSTNGFLRYQLEDVVRCTRAGALPDIEYIGRLDGAVSAVGEKMTELHLRSALEATGLLRDPTYCWSAAIEWNGSVPRYVVWVENLPSDLPDFDSALCLINISYARKRAQGLLSRSDLRRLPPAVAVDGVRTGRFGQDKALYLSAFVDSRLD